MEVDPDGEQVGSHDPDDRQVHGAQWVPAAQAPLARVGVVIRQEVGGSIHPGEPPAAAEFEPHLRALLDVADVTRLQAMLGDEPERFAVQAVADRGSPGQPGDPPAGLQQRVTERHHSQPQE
jgi:hypothetical protein